MNPSERSAKRTFGLLFFLDLTYGTRWPKPHSSRRTLGLSCQTSGQPGWNGDERALWQIASKDAALSLPKRTRSIQERKTNLAMSQRSLLHKNSPWSLYARPIKDIPFNSNGNRRHLRVTSGERRGAGLGVEKSPSRNLASLAARAEGKDGPYYRLLTCGSDVDSSSTRRRGCLYPCTRLALNSSLMRNHDQHGQLY